MSLLLLNIVNFDPKNMIESPFKGLRNRCNLKAFEWKAFFVNSVCSEIAENWCFVGKVESTKIII